MSDDLTKVIAEATDKAFPDGPWVLDRDTDGHASIRGATGAEIAARITAALAPLIEARVREAQVWELREVAKAIRRSEGGCRVERTCHANDLIIVRARIDSLRVQEVRNV